jgi:beta-ring hydroxylase
VYTVLREAELRSTAPIPYWNVPLLAAIDPRQRRVSAALAVVNETLDGLIARCQRLVRLEARQLWHGHVAHMSPLQHHPPPISLKLW